MAMISCPECGKEISDNAKSCPNCGYSLKKNTKNKKGIIISIVIVIVIVIIGAIGFTVFKQQEIKKQEELLAQQHQQEISELKTKIQNLDKDGIPAQSEYDALYETYSSLSDEDKSMIDTASILDKYNGVDLDKVSDMADKIGLINENSAFSIILELQDEYENLDSNEQEFIDNSKLESAMQLSDIENAALSACKNVRSCMISSDSFQIKDITVKDDLDSMNFYWVLISYSGTNSFGATLDKTSCFGIGADFTDPFFGLAQITGYDQYLDSTTSYLEYSKCDKPEVSVDVDKITYYLDK